MLEPVRADLGLLVRPLSVVAGELPSELGKPARLGVVEHSEKSVTRSPATAQGSSLGAPSTGRFGGRGDVFYADYLLQAVDDRPDGPAR